MLCGFICPEELDQRLERRKLEEIRATGHVEPEFLPDKSNGSLKILSIVLSSIFCFLTICFLMHGTLDIDLFLKAGEKGIRRTYCRCVDSLVCMTHHLVYPKGSSLSTQVGPTSIKPVPFSLTRAWVIINHYKIHKLISKTTTAQQHVVVRCWKSSWNSVSISVIVVREGL